MPRKTMESLVQPWLIQTRMIGNSYIGQENIEILRMTGDVNPQGLDKFFLFLHYKHLTIFDHPDNIHKSLDTEPSTF